MVAEEWRHLGLLMQKLVAVAQIDAVEMHTRQDHKFASWRAMLRQPEF
jgi:hypothetical protein